jgi:hypothetical protein
VDAGALVTAGTYESNFRQFLRFIAPAVVRCPDQFTVIAPSVRKGIVVGGFIAIESKPGGLNREVSANKGLNCFSVSNAVDVFGHESIFLGRLSETEHRCGLH